MPLPSARCVMSAGSHGERAVGHDVAAPGKIAGQAKAVRVDGSDGQAFARRTSRRARGPHIFSAAQGRRRSGIRLHRRRTRGSRRRWAAGAARDGPAGPLGIQIGVAPAPRHRSCRAGSSPRRGEQLGCREQPSGGALASSGRGPAGCLQPAAIGGRPRNLWQRLHPFRNFRMGSWQRRARRCLRANDAIAPGRAAGLVGPRRCRLRLEPGTARLHLAVFPRLTLARPRL